MGDPASDKGRGWSRGAWVGERVVVMVMRMRMVRKEEKEEEEEDEIHKLVKYLNITLTHYVLKGIYFF